MIGNRVVRTVTVHHGESGVCLGEVALSGRLLRTSAVSCVWSGTDRYHEWFMKQYPNVRIVIDGGAGYVLRTTLKRAEAA